MVSIILVDPQIGENIGAAARSMLNFGFQDLRLVNPRDGWPNPKAEATASGAFDSMPQVRVYKSFKEAISDLHFVFATTSRSRDMVKPEFCPEKAALEYQTRSQDNQKIGFAFGGERSGLHNGHIKFCQAILEIPSNPTFPSLNLSQAVLLISYEISKLSTSVWSEKKKDQGHPPAKIEDISVFLQRLEEDLENRDFFRTKDLRQTMVQNITNIFTRADITEQELKTLHGILSALRGNKKPVK